MNWGRKIVEHKFQLIILWSIFYHKGVYLLNYSILFFFQMVGILVCLRLYRIPYEVETTANKLSLTIEAFTNASVTRKLGNFLQCVLFEKSY